MKIVFDWIKENKTGIFIAVIGQVIATIITSAITKLDFIKATKLFWSLIFNFFKTILAFNVPVWVIIIVIFLLYVIDKIITKRQESKNDNNWYADYTEDTYKGVLYSWSYAKNYYYGGIDLYNFRPICSCKGNVKKRDDFGFLCFYCPNCNKEFKISSHEEIEEAELFVRNNLKKKRENK